METNVYLERETKGIRLTWYVVFERIEDRLEECKTIRIQINGEQAIKISQLLNIPIEIYNADETL